MFQIKKEQLKELIEEAFDRGNQGCLDLKEEVIESLMEKADSIGEDRYKESLSKRINDARVYYDPDRRRRESDFERSRMLFESQYQNTWIDNTSSWMISPPGSEIRSQDLADSDSRQWVVSTSNVDSNMMTAVQVDVPPESQEVIESLYLEAESSPEE